MGWEQEIIRLMRYKLWKNRQEILIIHRVYWKITKIHQDHAAKAEKYFEQGDRIEERGNDEKIVGKRAIYLVFSFAPDSSMARAIVAYTDGYFSHVAIALEESLTNMYSFTITKGSRFSDIEGGFTYENIHSYRSQQMLIQVNRIWINDIQYGKIRHQISVMAKRKKRTSYNLKGLIRYVMRERYETDPESMYCSEFIMYLLNGAGIEMVSSRTEQISPQELADKVKELEGGIVYRGRAEGYETE